MKSARIASIILIFFIGTILIVHFFGTGDKITPAEIIENSMTSSGSSVDNNFTLNGTDIQAAKTPPIHEKKEDFRYIQERLTAMQERRPTMNFDPAEVAAAIERDVAWKTLKEVPTELPLTPEELTDGREFISLDGLKIETLMPGDRVRIPIQELDKEFDVTIDTVEKHDYNSISWNGHIEGGDGQNYHATFTRSASLTVGGMETPDGQYQLQANGDTGWIASANLLFKNHADPIVPDTATPDTIPIQPEGHSSHSHEH